MAATLDILFKNQALRQYFAEEVLIDIWRWDKLTYSYIDTDFEQTKRDFGDLITSELIDQAISRIPSDFKGSSQNELREEIRKAAISKIAYTFGGNEVFAPHSSVGPNNSWIEKSRDGINFKIGKVVEMATSSKMTGSNQREIIRLIQDEETLHEVETWLYPGIADNSVVGLEKYQECYERGRLFREFERTHKIPAFLGEIFIDADSVESGATKGIAFRLSPEWMREYRVSQEDLMTIGIYPYCSQIVRDFLDQSTQQIESIKRDYKLPSSSQVRELKNRAA